MIIGMYDYVLNLGSGDGWDLYWYNNKAASGSQLYPTGLSKYFDLYSLGGLTEYFFHWVWDFI